MHDHSATHHPHRQNWDGSFDSICMTCFRTIAHGQSEAELAEKEAAHTCEPSALTQSVRERHWSSVKKPESVRVNQG